MVGRSGWRKGAAFAGGVGLTAIALLAVGSGTLQAQAGGFMSQIRSGIRLLGTPGQDPLGGGVRIETKSARVLEREADQRARNPHLLQWGGVEFDPLMGVKVPDGVPAELAAPARELPPALAVSPDDVDYWIVQYEGATGPVRDALRKTGVDFVGIVPNRGYLVRADGGQAGEIQQLRDVRWVSRNLPAWKLDGACLQMLNAGGDASRLPLDPRGLVRLGIRLYPLMTDEQVEAYAEALKALPGAEFVNGPAEEGEIPTGRTFLLGADPAAVKDLIVRLAVLRDVADVWSAEMPKLHNDQAVWFVQSGNDQLRDSDYDQTAPLFARGVTGRGLIGAVCDDGLENDMCQFRYSNSKNDAAWPVGPSAAPQGTAVPDEQFLDLAAATPAVRTRDRKVVAYYLMSGAAAYSSPIQHGTAVAGCMLGDNNSVLAARPLVRDLGERQNVRPWRATGTWTNGQSLRDDVTARVDDPTRDESYPNTYGSKVEHHQAKDGMAPGAQLIMQDVGDADGNLSGLNGINTVELLFLQTSKTGGTVHNASFGGNPCYDCYVGDAIGADSGLFYRRTLVSFVSAGNEGVDGPRTIGGGHQQSKSPIVVGWSERGNSTSCPTPGSCPTPTTRLGHAVNRSSSKGPKSGGLLAPEITAPGTLVSVAEPGNPVPNPEDGTGSADGGCGPSTPGVIGGTSFAAPIAAGTGLLVQQYFWDGYYPSGAPAAEDALRPTNALVRAVLVNSARNLEGAFTDDTGAGQAPRPNFGQGWGSPRLDDTLYFSGDPKRGNPEFETERARLVVLNDVPNGFDGSAPLADEPGGKTRDQIVAGFSPALGDNNIQEFFLNVVNDSNGDGSPDPDDKANELRVTLAWSDYPGSSRTAPQVNNLDLEVVSPGPDGTLQTTSGTVLGDDVVYRTKPSTSWSGGFTVPSPTGQITNTANMNTPFTDTDVLNTVENVFIKSQDVVAGTHLIRVIARDIRSVNGTAGGFPNFAIDQTPSRDTDGDTVPDQDEFDNIFGDRQGYALVVSGNFTTDQGLISINKSNFGCEGEELTLTLNDQNGGSGEPPCGTRLSAVVKTTTPGPAFPSDRETVLFAGTQPTYRSQNPVTGAGGFEVRLVLDPADVIHGNGVIEIAHGETIVAEYVDNAPCGGKAFAQATISCQPSIQDQGYQIAEGCDYAAPGDPASGARPDGFMDAGELNRYQVFLANTGAVAMNDCIVSLYPDPDNANAGLVQVLDSPRYLGYAPPGRIDDVSFLVQVDPAMPAQWQMDFIVEVVSPRDGLLFPATFRQSQIFEADVISYRYDTRDPNGELYKRGRIEIFKPGVDPNAPPFADTDYVTNEPMWYDPDTNPPACRTPRNLWPAPDTPPLTCLQNGNPLNPWDFDDTNDGWFEAAHDGDALVVGVDTAFQWNWKNAPDGGGCGWEDQLHRALSTGTDPLPVGHPDRIAQPWGIWHTGEINRTNLGPFAGDPTNNQGVPFRDTDNTIMWDPPPAGGADNNSTGQWCNTYLSSNSRGAISIER